MTEELSCWFDARDGTKGEINDKGIGNAKMLDTK